MENLGLFITFEGADGCGKTTQIELLNKYLQEKGFKTLVTREPGAKGWGEKLREILLNYDGDVSPTCESFLFLADRAQHVDCIIKPALKEGIIVLCDRQFHQLSAVTFLGVYKQIVSALRKVYGVHKQSRRTDCNGRLAV